MKTKILVAALAATFVAAPAAHAKLKISGQVNVAALFGESGNTNPALDSSTTVVDNNTTGSRFRFTGSTKFGNGLKVGFRYELQGQFNQSNDPLEITNSGADPIPGGGVNSGFGDVGPVREVRYADIYVKGNFGKIAIGRGDGASNNTAESAGLINFLGANESHLLFNGVGAEYADIESFGNGRNNRIRYDSPKFNGWRFAYSRANGDVDEFAIRHDSKLAGGKIRFRAGITDGEGANQETYSTSIAYKHSSGFSASYYEGEIDGNRQADWLLLGYTYGKITFTYGTGTDENEAGAEDDLDIWSINYKPAKGVEIYLNYGDWNNETTSAGQPLGGGSVFALGSRVKF